MSKFEVKYEVDDGYVSGSRPQRFYIDDRDLDLEMNDSEIEQLFHDSIQDNFEQNIWPVSEDLDSFKEWAKNRIQEMRKEEEEYGDGTD